MISFTAISTLKLVSHEDPFLSSNILPRHDDHELDLVTLDYAFAVTAIEPSLGRVSLFHVSWLRGKDKDITALDLIDCKEFFDMKGDGNLSKSWQVLKQSIAQERKSRPYLCPIYPEELVIKGHYASAQFSYVNIKVIGCNLGKDKCLNDDEIGQMDFNFLEVKAYPSLSEGDENLTEVVKHTIDQTWMKYFTPNIR